MTTEAQKLANEFNRYFTSANSVDVPERVTVSRDEWRKLYAAMRKENAPATNPFEAAEAMEPQPCNQCSGTMRGSTNGYSVFLRCTQCWAVPMPFFNNPRPGF